MKRGTNKDWFFIAIQLILVVMCVYRAVSRENPLYYLLAVFWLLTAVSGVFLHFRAKTAQPQPAQQMQNTVDIMRDAGATSVKKPVRVIDTFPDKPQPIGYKTGWLCVKSASSEDVISRLGLKNAVPANWQSGLADQRSRVFVSPVVYGYVLVAGYDVFYGGDAEKELANLAEIAQKFPEVQCFETHRIVDFHTWAKFVNGSLVRAYGWLGESGEVFLNKGEITPEEVQLGFDRFIQSEDDDWEAVEFPNEESVMQIAAAWGVDPFFSDDKKYEYGVGYLCDK